MLKKNSNQITIKDRYSYEDFNQIKLGGFSLQLPSETLTIISKIAEQVGADSYIKVPVFVKKEYDYNNNHKGYKNKHRKKKKNREIINDDEWNIIRDFKSTKIVKKEGVESIIDSIRKNLNKMTDATYDTQKKEIFDIISEHVDSENNEILMKIGKQIFDIASNNKFYSKMYSTFCKELINNYTFMNNIIQEKSKEFLELFNEIEYCDPQKDYDKFCDINKKNDNRRSLCLFYVNLTYYDVLTVDYIVTLTNMLMTLMEEHMEQENKKNQIEEIIENIYILIKDGYDILIKTDHWDSLFQKIETISGLKPKDKTSLSNKTIFKCMDIVDFVEDQDE